jgi:dCMP deaminase
MVTKKDVQFMSLCIATSKIFSTCKKKQYAAVLVDQKNHVIGMGYNGGPSGFEHCFDGGCRRYFDNSPSGSSYNNCIAIHAEANALLHSDYSSAPKKLYVNGPPCYECAKLIANSTVEEVFYLEDPGYTQWNNVKLFLNKAGISLYEVNNAGVEIKLSSCL